MRGLVRVVAAVLVLALAVAGWLGVRTAMAVSTLVAAQPALQDVTSAFEGGERATVLRSADEVRSAVARTRDLIDEPVWRTAERLPWLGSRLHAVRSATEAADILATDALGPAIGLADTISFGPYREGEGYTELVQATELRGDLDAVADAVVRARAAVDGVTTDLFVPQLSEPFSQVISTLDEAAEIAAGAGPGLDLLLDVSGYSEPALTAVVVLDERVARPLGGEIERVYLLTAERGVPQRLTRLDRAAVRAAAAASPALTNAAAGPQDALLTPLDVSQLSVTADAGAALAEGIAAVEGVSPRSVVLVTPQGLDFVHAPAADEPSTASLVDSLESAPADERGAVLDEALSTILRDVLGLRAAADRTALAIGEAVASGDLRVWSADHKLQEALAEMRGGGGLPGGGTVAVAVTADAAGAPGRLEPSRLTTATGQCGSLWTRRSEAQLTVAVAEVPEVSEDAVAPRLLVAMPRDAVVLRVDGPEGALPYEVLDLGNQHLLTVTPGVAGDVTVRLAGGTQSLESLDVVARGGVPDPVEGTFSCTGPR